MPATFTFDLPASPGCPARPCGAGNRVFLLLNEGSEGMAADGSGVLIGEITAVAQVNLTLWRYTVAVADAEMADTPTADDMQLFLSCVGAESEALLKKMAVIEAGEGGAPVTQPVLANRLCLGLVSDVGEPGTAQTNVVTRLNSWGAEYVLDAGDNDYLGGNPAAYASFGSWIGTQKYLRVRGNHSLDTPTEIAADAASFPYLFTDGNPWWKRVLGNGLVEIFGIETGRRTNGTFIAGNLQVAGGAQYLWLRAALRASTARHKIVMFHQPPCSSGNDPGHDICPEMDWDILGLADALLCGHTHQAEWLIYRGLPVINFSGSVRTNGTSQVAPTPATNGNVRPVFLNDIDRLIGRIWVTGDDCVIEGIDTVTNRTVFSRSIYEKSPRPYLCGEWIYGPYEEVRTDTPHSDIDVTVLSHAVRLHSVGFSHGRVYGLVSGRTVQLLADDLPVTNSIPMGQNTRISGVDLSTTWLPAGTHLVARVVGWGSYVGTPAQGLRVELTGDIFA